MGRNYDAAEIGLSKRMMSYWANSTKREVLELNANVSRVLEGHRVKKCAFWKKFLPRLLSLTEAPRPCESMDCCDGNNGIAATSTTGNSLRLYPLAKWPLYVLVTFLFEILFSAVPITKPIRMN